jgi:hypothetical protein
LPSNPLCNAWWNILAKLKSPNAGTSAILLVLGDGKVAADEYTCMLYYEKQDFISS